MDNETSQIFKEQIEKLPSTVVDFIASSNWQEELTNIVRPFRLTPSVVDTLENEVVLVLAGLVHPDAFHSELVKQTGVDEVVLSGVISEIEEKIFGPVRTELIRFYEEQSTLENSNDQEMAKGLEKKDELVKAPPQKEPSPPAPAQVWEKVPEVVPTNLPTEKGRNVFTAEIIPQTIEPEKKMEMLHPFEEKMKKVFVGVSTPESNPSLEASIEPTISTDPLSRARHDPYREPIE